PEPGPATTQASRSRRLRAWSCSGVNSGIRRSGCGGNRDGYRMSLGLDAAGGGEIAPAALGGVVRAGGGVSGKISSEALGREGASVIGPVGGHGIERILPAGIAGNVAPAEKLVLADGPEGHGYGVQVQVVTGGESVEGTLQAGFACYQLFHVGGLAAFVID